MGFLIVRHAVAIQLLFCLNCFTKLAKNNFSYFLSKYVFNVYTLRHDTASGAVIVVCYVMIL